MIFLSLFSWTCACKSSAYIALTENFSYRNFLPSTDADMQNTIRRPMCKSIFLSKFTLEIFSRIPKIFLDQIATSSDTFFTHTLENNCENTRPVRQYFFLCLNIPVKNSHVLPSKCIRLDFCSKPDRV